MPALIAKNTQGLPALNIYRQLQPLLRNIARYQHFDDGDLIYAFESTPCTQMAEILTSKYFHRSQGMVVYEDMILLFRAFITTAPILHKIKNSMRLDQNVGKALTLIRVNTARKKNRIFYSLCEFPRVVNSQMLRENLQLLGVHDQKFILILIDLYKAYYSRESVSGKLAQCLFDPIILSQQLDDESFRISNLVLRMKSSKFAGSLDLRSRSLLLLSYRLQLIESGASRHLEILANEQSLAEFRQRIRKIVNGELSPSQKVTILESNITKLAERIRYARHGFVQVISFSNWLRDVTAPIRAPGAEILPSVLKNRFLQRQVTARCYSKLSSFNLFYDLSAISFEEFMYFFNPYREVQ